MWIISPSRTLMRMMRLVNSLLEHLVLVLRKALEMRFNKLLMNRDYLPEEYIMIDSISELRTLTLSLLADQILGSSLPNHLND